MKNLAQKHYMDNLTIIDVVFGAFLAGMIALAGVAWMKGLSGFRSVAPFILIIVLNLGISGISRRLVRSKAALELFRFFFVNGALCPLAYVWVEPPLAPCWYVYAFIAVGFAPIMTGLIPRSLFWSRAATVFSVLNFLVTTYFWVDRPNWYLISVYAAVIGVLGICFAQIVHHLHEGICREIERSTALFESQERSRLAHEASQMASWDLSTVSREILWSEELNQLYGLGAPASGWIALEVFLGQVHPEDREMVTRQILESISQKVDYHLEFRAIHAQDQKVRWMLAIGRPLQGPSGEIQRLIGVTMNISRRKDAEHAFEEQRARMVSASKMSALGEMAGGIAHEINNPLAIVQGTTEVVSKIVESGAIEPEVVIGYMNRMRKAVVRISSVVRSLQSFARDGSQDPFSDHDLKGILEEVLELCRERFRKHGIRLEAESEMDSIWIRCRAVEIAQVFINLLNNAHDAVLGRPDAAVWVRVKAREGRVEVSVADNGLGIAPNIKEKIFQPFFTTKAIGSGTGLGLSVSQGIVAAHGGELALETGSASTSFVVRLPRATACE